LQRAMLDLPARKPGPLDCRDARSKLAALLVFLLVLSTARRAFPMTAGAMGILLAAACVWANVPVLAVLRRAAVVLPFTLFFAAVCWIGGDLERGLALMAKSYLSCLAVCLVAATTPLPSLLRGFESFGAPRFLLMVAQFVYRYLFVISGEAKQMAQAALARGGTPRGTFRLLGFQAAAGALAVLFARSYARAGEVHRAMLARGFGGQIRNLDTPRFQPADAAFLAAASVVPVLVRLTAERLA
jgi:cobalt/nickel transport system permease protein